MAFINIINEEEATGVLKDTYQEIEKSRGKVGNILKVHSLNPESMQAHFDLYMTIMFKNNSLQRVDRELIGTAVSAANNCEYCVLHHAEALNHYWKDDEKVESFMKDPTGVELDEQQGAMVDYVTKLTKSPDKMEEADVLKLKEAGFNDDDILNMNLVASYFNFVNRIAMGLGVEFTPAEIKGYKY